MSGEIGGMLAKVRSEANLTQREVADRMGVSQTRVSRLETGEGEDGDVDGYLGAVGSPGAASLRDLLKVEWRNLPPPALHHPDIETLIEVERGLARVRAFLDDGQVPTVLSGQAELLVQRLEAAARYLLALDHDVVYVGEIGVGKTTAACRQAGLVVDAATAADLRGIILDTGGGRTTLCDARVETGEHFAVTVEPLPDEEIYKLVAEVCRGVFEKRSGEASAATPEFAPPEEVERALRNMARLPRPPRLRRGGPVLPDPAAKLAGNYQKVEDFTAEVAARLSLWRRSRRMIEFDGIDPKAGRQWLKSNFTAINRGLHPEFSLPARIIVTVPFSLMPDERFAISILDTRGVDGTAIRPDILADLKDERAVTLLCSKWGSAPDPSAQALLTHVIETNADRSLLGRVAIVAIARSGDALSMRHDSGESPAEVEDGYDIKLGNVEDALQKIGIMGVDSIAFDASSDDPAELTNFLLKKIASIRKVEADAARATIAAIDRMIANREEAQAIAALEKVGATLARFATRHDTLPRARRAPHERLLAAVVSIHARTLWAATRRAGQFWNFNVFQYLGDGAAAEAKVRSAKVIAGLTEIIESQRGDPELASTHDMLAQILANGEKWEADFVNAARHHAVAIYSEPLGRDQGVWDACEAPYGTGRGGYRDGVAARLREWFEENVGLREELDRRVNRAWTTSVIEPLLRATGSTGEASTGSAPAEAA
jgi:transcriptional regulator with XRE-family HTH domain